VSTSLPKLIRITTVPQSLHSLLRGQLGHMTQYFEVVGVSSPGELLDRVAAEEGIRVLAVPMSRAITPFKDLVSLWRLYRLFKKEQPQIVHTHTPKAGILGMLAAWMASVPVRMHTVAGLPLVEASGVKRVILDQVEALTYRLAHRIYPNSQGQYEFILKYGYTHIDKLKVLANGSSNGINTSHFDPEGVSANEKHNFRKRLKVDEKDLVYIFVGRMVGDKGVNELVDAFSSLYRTHQNAALLLVGNFEHQLDPLLPETLQQMESHPAIHAVGFQSDVRPWLLASDVLVFPSYREGFPNVVMQAGAMGLPAIVSDINGCNEIVEEGFNGLIFPPKNTIELQAAMQRLYEDKPLTRFLAGNARELIIGRYQQEVVWTALLEEYRAMLHSAKS